MLVKYNQLLSYCLLLVYVLCLLAMYFSIVFNLLLYEIQISLTVSRLTVIMMTITTYINIFPALPPPLF